MRNPASPYTAMNIEKDYSIALEGQRMQREQIYRAQDEQRKDKEEYDKFSEKIATGMSQFDKMDIHRNDLDEVQNVEKAARKVITDALRSHGGDPRAFMRGGGASMLSTYFTQVTASKEYQNAQVSAQTYKLAQAAIEKGQRPNDFNLGTIDDPKPIPFELAVQMHNENKLVDANGNKMPITWAGSFKPIAMNDVLSLLDYVDSPTYRQLDPQEFEGLVRGQGVPDRYARELKAQYESVYYQKNEAGTVSKKNPFSVGPSKERLAEREGAANRAASLTEAKLRAEASAGGPKLYPHASRLSAATLKSIPTQKEHVFSAANKSTIKRTTLLEPELAASMTGVAKNEQPRLVWAQDATTKIWNPLYLGGSGGNNGYDAAGDLSIAESNTKQYGLDLMNKKGMPGAYTIQQYNSDVLVTSRKRGNNPPKDMTVIDKETVFNTGFTYATIKMPQGEGKHFGGIIDRDGTTTGDQFSLVTVMIEVNGKALNALERKDQSQRDKGDNTGVNQ